MRGLNGAWLQVQHSDSLGQWAQTLKGELAASAPAAAPSAEVEIMNLNAKVAQLQTQLAEERLAHIQAERLSEDKPKREIVVAKVNVPAKKQRSANIVNPAEAELKVAEQRVEQLEEMLAAAETARTDAEAQAVVGKQKLDMSSSSTGQLKVLQHRLDSEVAAREHVESAVRNARGLQDEQMSQKEAQVEALKQQVHELQQQREAQAATAARLQGFSNSQMQKLTAKLEVMADAKRSTSLDSWSKSLEDELGNSPKSSQRVEDLRPNDARVAELQRQLRAEISARHQLEKSMKHARHADAQQIEQLTSQLEVAANRFIGSLDIQPEPETNIQVLERRLQQETASRKQSGLMADGVKRRLEARVMELNQKLQQEVGARELADLESRKVQHRDAGKIDELTQQLHHEIAARQNARTIAISESAVSVRSVEQQLQERVGQLQLEIEKRQQAEAIGMEMQSQIVEEQARAGAAAGALRAVEEQNQLLERKRLDLKVQLQASENSSEQLRQRLLETQLELSESWASSNLPEAQNGTPENQVEVRLAEQIQTLKDQLQQVREEMFQLQKADVAQSFEDSRVDAQPLRASSGHDELIKDLNAEMLNLQKEVLKLETQLESQATELEKAKQRTAGGGSEAHFEKENILLHQTLKDLQADGPAADTKKLTDQNSSLKDNLRQLQTEIFEMQKVSTLETDRGGSPEELERLRAQNEQLELNLYQLKSELERALGRETKLKAAMKELRAELFEVQQAYTFSGQTE